MVNKTTFYTFEILEKISSTKTKAEKIELLRKEENNWPLKDLLRGTFDEAIVWLLPEPGGPTNENNLDRILVLSKNSYIFCNDVFCSLFN